MTVEVRVVWSFCVEVPSDMAGTKTESTKMRKRRELCTMDKEASLRLGTCQPPGHSVGSSRGASSLLMATVPLPSLLFGLLPMVTSFQTILETHPHSSPPTPLSSHLLHSFPLHPHLHPRTAPDQSQAPRTSAHDHSVPSPLPYPEYPPPSPCLRPSTP